MVKDDKIPVTENIKVSYQGFKKASHDGAETNVKTNTTIYYDDAKEKAIREAECAKNAVTQHFEDPANDQLNDTPDTLNRRSLGEKVKEVFHDLKEKVVGVVSGGEETLPKNNDDALIDENIGNRNDTNISGTNYYGNEIAKENEQKLENADQDNQLNDSEDVNIDRSVITMLTEGFYDLKDKLVEIGEHLKPVPENPKAEEAAVKNMEQRELTGPAVNRELENRKVEGDEKMVENVNVETRAVSPPMSQRLYNALNQFNQEIEGDAENVAVMVRDAFYDVEELDGKPREEIVAIIRKHEEAENRINEAKENEEGHAGATDTAKGPLDNMEDGAIEFFDDLNNKNKANKEIAEEITKVKIE